MIFYLTKRQRLNMSMISKAISMFEGEVQKGDCHDGIPWAGDNPGSLRMEESGKGFIPGLSKLTRVHSDFLVHAEEFRTYMECVHTESRIQFL